MLQDTIKTYEDRLAETVQQLEELTFQNEQLKDEVNQLNVSLQEKDQRNFDLKIQNEKLLQLNNRSNLLSLTEFPEIPISYNPSRTGEVIKQITFEFQKYKKNAIEDINRLNSDTALMRSKINVLENTLENRDNEIFKLQNSLADIQKRENEFNEQMFLKNEQIVVLEKEKLRYSSLSFFKFIVSYYNFNILLD